MSDPVRVFIGTDSTAMRRAEIALEYSIRKNCSVDVQVFFMDKFRDNEIWHGWNDAAWYTPFTNFRFAIPGVSNFEGRSIYVDVDQECLTSFEKFGNPHSLAEPADLG